MVEKLRHKIATEDKLRPELIDGEIINVLQIVIADLQRERFRLEWLSRVLLEELGVTDQKRIDRIVARALTCKIKRTSH
jgi:hypothetical protein